MGMGNDLDTDVGAAADVAPTKKKGLDRRTLIKRAAATGAVAWTAPIILDSLASPAAAGTCGRIYRVTTEFVNTAVCASMVMVKDQKSANGPCTADVTPPAGYSSTVTNLTPANPAGACLDFGGSTDCGATKTGATVTATLSGACTPTGLTGCSTPLSFLAAQLSVNHSTSNLSVCQYRRLGGSTTYVSGPAIDYIPTVNGTTVQFTIPPAGTKPNKSGSFQFVIGCGCS